MTETVHEITPDLAYVRALFANVVFLGAPDAGDRGWVLVDTGLPGSAAGTIRQAAARFGAGSRPAAIVLTHGHFDHAGTAAELAERWDVPVFAHPAEIPALDGRAPYAAPRPRPDDTAMIRMAGLFPREPIVLRRGVTPLPADGSIPFAPAWRALHTPGHTDGHICLWREQDRMLVAGDAFVATDGPSGGAVLREGVALQGPPPFYTSDWDTAELSVQRLSKLGADVAVTGHGPAVGGERYRQALRELAETFRTACVPQDGSPTGAPAHRPTPDRRL